ncbi:MAG TPA: murein biosynthesis integral membrane protein MurJ, partial [Candidatus Glassbacteria bacterium]|nr:murein biosynthesis integral membrane protein MurJ [Candidatus Glassbacteria bacterium]
MNDSTPDPAVASAAAQRQRIFLQSAAIVGVSILLSRVLGLFREWTIAYQVGSNAITDAYYAAFTIPDILNYLLAGGSLSVTFIPVFLEYCSGERKEEAWRVFSIVLSAMAALLLVLLVVAEIYAGTFARLIAPGFTAEQQELVTYLTRIMLPAQVFFFLGGLLTAVQYAQGRFLIPSLAPLIYNSMIIAFGLLLSSRWGIQAFSWGVLAGAFVGNFLLQLYGAMRVSARFRFSFQVGHAGFRRFVRLTLPVMLGFSLIFIDDWAIRWCGSFLVPASITWLGYGKTLMRVAVALFGQAAGVATFPILARLAAEKKWPEMKEGLQEALRHVILTIVPVSVLMMILSRPIVFLLFSRTRMQAHDLEQTALAMTLFLVGAVAWGTQAILGRGFYALGDTLTPSIIGSALALAWLPVYWYSAQRFEHVGLAAASSLGVMVYSVVLLVVLYRRLQVSMASL